MTKYKLIKVNSCKKNGIKKHGESCTLNNNCVFPNCNEEHLCEKISIDGFDYYVSDEIVNSPCYIVHNINKLNFIDSEFDFINVGIKDGFYGKVIATNNPSIEVPKIVDEIKEVFGNSCDIRETDELLKDGIGIGFKVGYKEAKNTYPNSDEDMIEFAEWVENLQRDNKEIKRSNPNITTKELLQLWKEQIVKTLYYE